MKKKLYIGCALTVIPLEKREPFLKLIAEIKKELGKSFEILEFLGLVGPSTLPPQEVYVHDIKNSVMKADCMLAICDYPSLGLGYEIATAVEKQGIPVLAIAHKDSTVTRLIRGINHKNFHFIYYNSIDEIFGKTLEILTK
jgi:hypothetical protein